MKGDLEAHFFSVQKRNLVRKFQCHLCFGFHETKYETMKYTWIKSQLPSMEKKLKVFFSKFVIFSLRLGRRLFRLSVLHLDLLFNMIKVHF